MSRHAALGVGRGIGQAHFLEVQKQKRREEVASLWPLTVHCPKRSRALQKYIETGDQAYINLVVDYVPPITVPQEVDEDEVA